jgi:Ca2+-transporting ATPase
MLAGSLALGASLLAAVAAVYALAIHAGRTEGEIRALGFAAIVLGNLALLLCYRSERRSMLRTLAEPNPACWWIVAATVAALLAVIYVPGPAALFHFAPAAPVDLALAAALAVLGVAWYDAVKLAARRSASGLPKNRGEAPPG